jgi:hypothetical protein
MESDSAGEFILYFICIPQPDAYQELTTCYSRRIWSVRRMYCRVNKSRRYSAIDWKGAAI